jgi:hypothetical protein
MTFLIAHQTTLSLAAAWLFSAVMSSMPAVDPSKLSFPVRWLLSFAQFLAANLHKV